MCIRDSFWGINSLAEKCHKCIELCNDYIQVSIAGILLHSRVAEVFDRLSYVDKTGNGRISAYMPQYTPKATDHWPLVEWFSICPACIEGGRSYGRRCLRRGLSHSATYRRRALHRTLASPVKGKLLFSSSNSTYTHRKYNKFKPEVQNINS